MKNRLLLLITTGAVILVSSNIHSQNFVQVTRTNQEQTINLSADQVLEIQLPRKASTGYIWIEAPASSDKVQKIIAQIGDGDFIHDPGPITPTNPKGMIIGGSGKQIIRYVGISQGTTTLTLELRRPWIKNGEVIDSYSITVVSSGKYTGTYAPPLKKAIHKYDKPLTSPTSTLPSSWDWRPQCTPVVNQNQCGDCWACATVGTLECNILIHDGVTRDISEEFVTDCYTYGGNYNGCGGAVVGAGSAHQAWMASYTGANTSGGGAVYESEDPWTSSELNGTTGTCGAPYTPHETIDRYADIGGEVNYIPPVDSIKYHIYYHGPVWAGMDASDNSFQTYNGKIWVVSGSSVDHAIVLAGWKDTTVSDGSGGYWILRNSWGTGWGVNGSGYMYISYGSALVGYQADYIVYKGGIPHAVPPVANFTANETTSCSSIIQFTDESSNSPTSWAWTFGDGGTSTLQNPSHSYTANGTYTVSLKAMNTYGNNTKSVTSYINISGMPTAASVTGCSTTSGGSCTLTASGSGTLNWYNAATGGTLVHTGTSYTINPLTSNQTLYVEDDVIQPTQAAGMAAMTSNGSYFTGAADRSLIFNALSNITIDTVTVYAGAAGTRTIWLKNSSGAMLDSISPNIASGTQKVALNFSVPTGTGYQLGTDNAPNLYRETSGATYPMTTSLVSITGNNAGSTATAYYYFFYNWRVSAGGPSCFGPRIPVTATILTGINEFSEGGFNVFPNPNTGSFDIKLNEQNIQNATVSIANMLGQTVLEKTVIINNNSSIHIDAANLKQGMYFVKLQTDNATYLRKILITTN
ncbi:MAG: C1 family peptidase [Bacteroidales bacterium]